MSERQNVVPNIWLWVKVAFLWSSKRIITTRLTCYFFNTGTPSVKLVKHWKQKVVILKTFSSLVAPRVQPVTRWLSIWRPFGFSELRGFWRPPSSSSFNALGKIYNLDTHTLPFSSKYLRKKSIRLPFFGPDIECRRPQTFESADTTIRLCNTTPVWTLNTTGVKQCTFQ